MDRQRWRRIERILDLVLDAAPADRDQLLPELCGTDTELRAEVEAMLRACSDAEDLFEEAPPMIGDTAPSGEDDEWTSMAPGTVIGHWRIVREIGRGGMGAVFLAERADGQFEKTAALKIVKRGMDSDEILQRFWHERQILAHLEHPNIAGLLDGGRTDEGLPYFVMELAQGQPIDEYCRERGVDVRARLEMFLDVCDAVHYAHRGLVVHRDLKPDNIVVVDGQVKLLDFGIAKLVSADEAHPAAGLTQVYSQRLTPRYAAPEQVTGGPTTTAADVYSLGVVLYELLCGHAPYEIESNSLIELERVIGRVIPKPPSTRVEGPLSVTLRGDLDAICLKALRKDPAERYESAAALAGDLRHYLDGAPVRARPQTRRYRLAKFVRRNRLPVALAAAAVVSLLLGTAVSMWQAAVAQNESELRLVEAERATAARDYLISWLTTFDPNTLEGQREFSVDELVEVGFENLASLQAQPQVRAAVMNTLGGILFNFGRWGRADSVYRAAHAALETRGDHPDLAVSMMGIGEVWRVRGQFDSARAWFEEALVVRLRALPPGDERIAETEEALAFTLYNLGSTGAQDARKDSLLIRAYELRQEVAGNEGLPAELRARALEGLGDIDVEMGDYASAVPAYRRAYTLRVEALGYDNPENGYLLWGLARALQEEGDLGGAEEAYRDAVTILRDVYPEPHPAVATAYYNLAFLLDATDRPVDAAVEYRHSVDEWSATGEANLVWAGYSWVGLGITLLEVDSAHAAEASLRRGLAIYESFPEVGRTAVARARAKLGEALSAQGRLQEALSELRASHELFVETDPALAATVQEQIDAVEAEIRARG